MKIAHKILIVPAAAFCCLLLMGLLSFFSMRQNEARMHDLKENTFAAFRSASQQTIAIGQLHAEVYAKMAIAASLSEQDMKAFGEKVNQEVAQVAKEVARLQSNPEAAELARQVPPLLEKYRAGVAQALDLASMDPNTGVAAMQGAGDNYRQLRALLAGVLARLDAHTNESLLATKGANGRAMWASLFTMLAGVAVLSAISLWLARAVVTPIGAACVAAEQLASGDLTTRIEVRNDDEIGKLSAALATLVANWRTLLGEIRVAGSTITAEARDIAQGNADLSARTESQASSLEQTAASMQDLTNTVRENADHARQANQLVLSASDVALKGGQVVSQVVHTMASIKESSNRIVDIIGVIDSIAFQTNILALNAAVEAARAGEQGRGFAVVATEVRNLAQRSATAAREIKDLIADSVEKVENGSRLADDAGQTMGHIVESVKRVTDIMGDITLASQKQSAGIDEVNSAITEMDDMTQRNAALVEQSAAAAQSMQDQAVELLRAVSNFRLDEHAAQPPAAPTSLAGLPAGRRKVAAAAPERLTANQHG